MTDEDRGKFAPWQSRRVRSYIELHIEHPGLRIRQLAAAFSLSPSHFCRTFHKTFGVPPRQFIIERRVERSQTLILQGHQSLCEIAVACGFCDQPHFNRLFRKLVGASPRTWRLAQPPSGA
jgi:AraC-like DNA-binding protein